MLQLVLLVTMVILPRERLSELVKILDNGLDLTLLANVSTVIRSYKRRIPKFLVHHSMVFAVDDRQM